MDSNDPKKIKVVTKKEAANICRVSTRTIENWEKSGYIKAIKIGGIVRFNSTEIKRVLGLESNEKDEI